MLLQELDNEPDRDGRARRVFGDRIPKLFDFAFKFAHPSFKHLYAV